MIDALRLLNFSSARRLPVIRQTEATECGLACLAMIAGYHGYKTDLSSLRLAHAVSLKGSTLKNLIVIAEQLDLGCRPLQVELESLDQLRTPCILHWNMNHFVVLKDVKRNAYLIHDPAHGEKRHTSAEVSSNFTGIALELSPTSNFKHRDNRKSMRLADMWGRIVGLKGVLAQTLILSLIVQLFVLVLPFYMQLVVDEVLTSYDTDLLVVLALGFGLLMIINEIATALRSYVILYISNTLGFQMVSNLFSHLLRLPLNWYEKRHVGDIVSRFSSTRPIRDLFAEGLVAAVIDGLMALSTLIVIFVYSRLLGLVVVITAALYLLLRLVLYKPLRQNSEDQIVAMAREQSTFIESVRGIQSIKIFGHEAERRSLWQNRYADVINSSVKVGKLRIGFNAANGLLFGIENTFIVYLGALLVVDASLTIGMLFAFMAYKRQFIDKASMLVERIIDFRLLDLHLERIADIGLARPERGLEKNDGIVSFDRGKSADSGTISVENVSFRYGAGDAWILREASLTIERGEMISIIGPSGCGKSTLMKLILGLFEADSGTVHFDGCSLQKYGHASYRRKIGTVMQDDSLLAGSIADNISFFDTDPDAEKLRRCAENAAIHSDIASMPMGYNSLVGDMGGVLSAGQRQRVLLARALYREPEILILDEGTANLDAMTESKIIRLLKQLKITRICVAHRQAMIMASDRVVQLRNGTLLELNKQQLATAFGRRQVTENQPANSQQDAAITPDRRRFIRPAN
ncbi:MAG: peptidase domain-containing ABC transporter [Gammaproteobacteria bacterium]|nr:MAG: peptidase domain-containing ABC transporter [Gammaproteobacteria bacterium]